MFQIKTIVFDLDDTLIETGRVFRGVLLNLCEVIERRSAPTDREEILRRQNDIDVALLAEAGATPDRFSRSLVMTYREFVQSTLPEDETFLAGEGLRAFQEVPDLSTDTLAVLEQTLHCELLLYTWGRQSVQMPRIRAHRLDSYFAEIHCVEEKNLERFRSVIGNRAPQEVLMCGDSLKLDIAPAVAAGCHAAHLHRPDGWSYLHGETKIDGSFHRLSRLGELIGVIGEIERGQKVACSSALG